MPQDPFPDPGPDGETLDSSPLLPDAAEDGPADHDWGMEQGLYVCTPAEQLTLSGFAQGGQADTMAPGPLLATVVDTVTGEDGRGLAGCSDDQLMGIISGARRQQSRDEWIVLAAMGEFARRAGTGVEGEFAADELGAELHMTQFSAAGQMDYAATVARRLPKLFAALRAGRISAFHLRIIEEETRILSDADAAKADALLAAAAPGMTYGEVRYAARKLVLTLDPEAVRKRKEAAKRDAHVRRFREDSGNGGMVARELPSAEILASWQHIEQRALDLRAAGAPGTLEELQARAFLDLLQERDSRPLATAPDPAAPDPGPPDPATPDPATPDSATPDAAAGDPAMSGPDQQSSDGAPSGAARDGCDGPDGPGGGSGGGPGSSGGPGRGPSNGPGGPYGPGGPGGPGPASGPDPATGPSLAALVNITIPYQTYRGRADTPGHADGFGVLDGDDARDLAAAAALHPRTRWCVTALNPDGTAAAHACLRGRHPPAGIGPPGTGPPGTGPSSDHQPPSGTGPPSAGPLPAGPPGIQSIPLIPIARGSCDHGHGEVGYHPSRKLAHLIRARNGTCTAPGCGRPTARCDLDHTVAWDKGGRTCECGLAPLCRHHHRCKQAQGWSLEQPEPGVLVWRTPAGRSYVTGPTTYSM